MGITISAYSASGTVSTTELSLTNSYGSTLQAQTDVGVFTPMLDLNALAAGDVFELRIYEKVATTQRLLESYRFAGGQTKPAWRHPSGVPLGVGWDMSIVKLAGTDRSIPSRIVKAA